MNEETKHRINILEGDATERFLKTVDWDAVIECLDKSQQEEYWSLILTIYPEHLIARVHLSDLKRPAGIGRSLCETTSGVD